MKPPTTTSPPPPSPTQTHLCRLIRFVWSLLFFLSLTKPLAPLPRLRSSLCFLFLSPCLSPCRFYLTHNFSLSSFSLARLPSPVGDPHVRIGRPPAHVLRGQDGGASLPDSEAAVVQISAGNGPRHLGQETARAGTVPAVGLRTSVRARVRVRQRVCVRVCVFNLYFCRVRRLHDLYQHAVSHLHTWKFPTANSRLEGYHHHTCVCMCFCVCVCVCVCVCARHSGCHAKSTRQKNDKRKVNRAA